MRDLIIIGAGPAGLTAALYAGRFRLDTLLLEKMAVGGQIILSPTIENFPGFPGGIATFELIERIKKQVDEVGVDIESQEALGIESFGSWYRVRAQDQSYEAKTIIIASGAESKKIGVPGEDKFIGRGVSYCGACDGPLFKDKEIIVVGGGERAIEEAIFLAGYAGKVNILHRRQTLRASAILEEKARGNPKINFILDSFLEEILGEDKVEAVKIRHKQGNALAQVSCDGVFIFVGIQPNTGFIKDFLEVDESGFIITGQELQASRLGIYACGDCRKKSLYQVINACGEGAQAADAAHKQLLGGYK